MGREADHSAGDGQSRRRNMRRRRDGDGKLRVSQATLKEDRQRQEYEELRQLIAEAQGKVREVPYGNSDRPTAASNNQASFFRPTTALSVFIDSQGRGAGQVRFFGINDDNEANDQQRSLPLAPTTCGQ